MIFKCKETTLATRLELRRLIKRLLQFDHPNERQRVPKKKQWHHRKREEEVDVSHFKGLG